jgi:quinol-cytochrome oxidoreductase complex cytochrome b subunit
VDIEAHKADIFIHKGVMFESQRCKSYRPDAVLHSETAKVMGYAYLGMGIPRQHEMLFGCVVIINSLSVFVALGKVLQQDRLIGDFFGRNCGFFRFHGDLEAKDVCVAMAVAEARSQGMGKSKGKGKGKSKGSSSLVLAGRVDELARISVAEQTDERDADDM